MSFADRLSAAVETRQSQIVLGLDPDPARIGQGAAAAEAFCLDVIAAAGPAWPGRCGGRQGQGHLRCPVHGEGGGGG